MPTQKKGWKYIQSKRQIAKKTKWALIALSLILGLLIFAQGVKLTKSLFSPWQSRLTRNYLWSGDFNINVIVRAKQISLVSFSPQDQKITIIDIPNETYLPAAKGFGSWMISSIYDLGESQVVGGANLLKETLANQFGLPIDGFLNFQGQYGQTQTRILVEEMRENPFSLITMLPDLKTDLTPVELIRLKIGLSKVRFDKVDRIDLGDSGIALKEKLPDGTDILSVDTVKLDVLLSEIVDPVIRSEHKTIAIFNSTNHPLLAQKAARLISNIGGDVIIISNGEKSYQKTVISGEKSKTHTRLKQIFGSDGTIDQTSDLASSRAQINLFLGEDFFDR